MGEQILNNSQELQESKNAGLRTQVTELVENRRFRELKNLLAQQKAADVALLLSDLPEDKLPLVFRILPKELAAEAFVEMDGDAEQVLLDSFTDVELKAIADELYADDIVDILEEMPANVVNRMLRIIPAAQRKDVNELLQYPPNSAGSIMTTEYIELKENQTVEQAFAHIRKCALDSETVYTCYVTDGNRHLIGVVSAVTLMISDPQAVLSQIMETNVISAETLDQQEFVANQIKRYDFLAMPVVDTENRLVGIVTFDDAMDVLTDEATEDIEKMAAIVPSENDKPYLKTSPFALWKKRIPWLLLLMISATFTGSIISSFEATIAATSAGVALLAFVPMLMDTGGNAGGQSSVTIIRGLALDEISFSDLFRILWKETRVAVLCGGTLAVCNFVKILLVDRMLLGNANITIWVDLVVCLTLVVTVLLAKIVGCTLPLLAKKLGFDPAVMASPFITTIVDALALLVYFQIAAAVLGV